MISKIAVASVVKLFYEFPMHTSRSQKLLELLSFLEGIHPASTILAVGGGSAGFDLESLCSNAETIYLCEPDSARSNKLKIRYNHLPQVTVHNCLIADKTGATDYHLTSLEAEDGLINPDQLRPIWKNIRLEKQIEVDAKTIQSFFVDISAEQKKEIAPDWLIIDCLPAPDILTGAGPLLETVDVVVLKLTSASNEGDNPLNTTGLTYLDAIDGLSGFRSVATLQSSNSAVFHGVYVRDWKHKAEIEVTEQIRILEASEHEAKSTIEAVQAENKSIGKELAAVKTELENFKELQEKIQAAEASEQATKKALEKAQGEIEELKNKLSTSSTDFQGLENKVQEMEDQAAKDQDQLQKEKRLVENNLEDTRQKYRELAEQRLADEEQWKQILLRLERLAGAASNDGNSKRRNRAGSTSKASAKTKSASNKRGKNEQESGDK